MRITATLLTIAASALLFSCARTRIKEKEEWGKVFEQHGVQNGCFILRDNNHESVYYYNLKRDSTRFLPASTFKIFNSLVALETGVAPDDQLIIKWDSVHRKPEWDKDMDMREAFAVSCLPYYQEIARRIGPERMQHYLDTTHYGNMRMGGAIDQFWLNDTLKITADEQLGFVKRLYFNELPFSERSQRIVRSLMLREDSTAKGYKLYYKTGWGMLPDKNILWVVGFAERIVAVKEPKESMNKSDQRIYPYFFSMNFELPADAKNEIDKWSQVRLDIVHEILKSYGAIN
jgi:beta-lactamase class D